MGFVLVFEFMVSDLSEVIKDAENPLSQEEIKGYMLMLLRGVAFIHEREVMHRYIVCDDNMMLWMVITYEPKASFYSTQGSKTSQSSDQCRRSAKNS